MTSLAAHLQSVKAPWVALVVLTEGLHPDKLLAAPDGFRVHRLNGGKCRTASGLFTEFARALSFPEYFGHNWDAFEECLADLEWLPAKGYVFQVNDADQVLADDEEEYATFLEVLSDAGEAWASGQGGTGRATPFHVLLTVSRHKKRRRAHWSVPEISIQGQARGSGTKRAGRPRTR